ncbi:hypothetical protein [Rhizobium sp. P32RR-XVIII]|uniref:hypothetical protein n=1 Tax=Rhizobium sp. P32RR-XVIII TaxID=2726738 RepID=UPI001FED7D60|nr:hypothetical protein [Rhizobium sp. P32RR-XVIII]
MRDGRERQTMAFVTDSALDHDDRLLQTTSPIVNVTLPCMRPDGFFLVEDHSLSMLASKRLRTLDIVITSTRSTAIPVKHPAETALCGLNLTLTFNEIAVVRQSATEGGFFGRI